MAVERQILKWDTMGDLDHGALRVAVNEALTTMMQDLHNRPALDAKRTMSLKFSLMPTVDKQAKSNDLEAAACEWDVSTKLPGFGAASTILSPMRDGQFVFMSDMPDAANDNTIYDEQERRRLEREERDREQRGGGNAPKA